MDQVKEEQATSQNGAATSESPDTVPFTDLPVAAPTLQVPMPTTEDILVLLGQAHAEKYVWIKKANELRGMVVELQNQLASVAAQLEQAQKGEQPRDGDGK